MCDLFELYSQQIGSSLLLRVTEILHFLFCCHYLCCFLNASH